MELIIIRHGRPQRVEKAEGDVADPDLNEAGHAQAAALATWLAGEEIHALYTSPMARARQTADPVESTLGMDATVVDGVREYDADSHEYIPMEDMKADKEAWRAWLAEEAARDRAEFRGEVLDSLAKIVADNRGRRVAVVCHGGVINTYAADVLGLDNDMFFAPDYTSINRFMAASSGERSVLSLNDTGHLRASPELLLR